MIPLSMYLSLFLSFSSSLYIFISVNTIYDIQYIYIYGVDTYDI